MIRWTRWILLALVALNAGWMAFDGARALVVGDYVTPSAGRYAGQLGPWSKLVEAVGIAPRSTFMKSVFVVYGSLALAMVAAFLLQARWARTGLAIVGALGLWYLPFGTLANLAALVWLAGGWDRRPAAGPLGPE